MIPTRVFSRLNQPVPERVVYASKHLTRNVQDVVIFVHSELLAQFRARCNDEREQFQPDSKPV
jgi:hypothetical protein